MNIKPAMSKLGFGHRKTRHIIIDHGGELWIAMAPAAAGGFLPMGATNLPGMLRVEPLENGETIPFTYTATESLLELTTGSGKKIEIAIDPDVGALRMSGDTALRLNGVEESPSATTLASDTGVIVDIGANHYVFSAKKGKITYNDIWLLHRDAVVINIAPEGGGFELNMFDLQADTDAPPITKTLAECAAGNSAEFQAFIGTLVGIPSEWDDVKEMVAYSLWLCHRVLDGGVEVVVENKYDSTETNSWLMAISSMAFTDAAKAVNMILAYPVGMPPIAGIAALRLIDDNMLCDSRNEIYKVYSSLEAAARRCAAQRAADNGGLSFYAYRFESGLDRPPEFFDAGEPVLAPDLNAYLIIVSEVLGKLAKMEYDIGIGNKWEARAKALQSQLIAELWDGEDFVGKNAYSGESSRPDDFLSLVPIVLGDRLPAEIIHKLASKINARAADGAVGLLLVGGLYDAGEKDSAKELTLQALGAARSNGFAYPFYAASLIALAHKVLL